MRTSTAVLWVLIVASLLAFGILYTYGVSAPADKPVVVLTPSSETENAEEMVVDVQVLPYGEAILALREKAYFPDVTLRVLSLEEESRCPSDVQCIQAGTVKVKIEIVSGIGTSTHTIALGESVTTEEEEISFIEVVPYPVSTGRIESNQYRFIFEVQKRAPVHGEEVKTPVSKPVIQKSQGECYIGGCSNQLCTDAPDVVSTCEYREEYACYQNATCKRQQNGQCGWTQTSELSSCLAL